MEKKCLICGEESCDRSCHYLTKKDKRILYGLTILNILAFLTLLFFILD